MNNIFSSINLFAHSLVQIVLGKGDLALDATAGNGYDTLFLARLVNPSGQVLAFDIQDEALKNTAELLANNDLLNMVQLINCGHENIEKIMTTKVKAIMFNLGYLPGGDHNLITRPETTIAGIKQSLDILEVGGIITIIIYTGHSGALGEKEAIEKILTNLDNRKWDVLQWSYLNKSEMAPLLIAIYRKGE